MTAPGLSRVHLLTALLGAAPMTSCVAPIDDVGIEKSALIVCAEGETTPGIDVSHWQGTIDWDAVAASDVQFAFIRVSHGTSTRDREFDHNWSEARRVGMMRGVYQFFSAADDPTAQADLLITEIGGALEPGDLPPVLDVEGMSLEGQPAATVVANMRSWIARIQDRLGVAPIIYSAKYFWQDQLGDPDFTEHPLWVAHYGVSCPNAPTPWTRWAFWQYTSTGTVPGISGNVDRNHFNGSIADLMAFSGAMAVCGDGWCSGGESNTTCAEDCPVCRAVPALGRAIDDSEFCFERGGPSMYLRDVPEGWLETLVWTHATDAADVANYGIWHLTFAEAGRYRLEAHLPAPFGESKMARYDVRHAGADSSFVVDQSAVDGWVTLGELDFAAGPDQRVRLDDNTGEPVASMTKIVFDAVRLTRLDPPPTPDAGGALDGGVSAPDAATPLEAGGAVDAGAPMPADGGCACRAGRGGSGGVPAWLVFSPLIALMTRRAGSGGDTV